VEKKMFDKTNKIFINSYRIFVFRQKSVKLKNIRRYSNFYLMDKISAGI
jgi:hypothetical protein